MMDLRRLRHVLALAGAENFARAADAVHLSQPAFSRSIQNLEHDLGVSLFKRGKRKVTLTPFGELVVDRARKLLWDADGVRRDVDMMKANELGNVHFGMGPMPAAMFLVAMLTRLAKESRGIRIQVELMHWQHLLQLLESERLDFFIADCRELTSSERLVITPMHGFRMHYYCRAKHPILRRRKVTSQDLLTYPLGSFKLPTASMAEVTQALDFAGDPAKLWAVQCDNLLVTECVVAHSDMILLGPEQAFVSNVRGGGIVELSLDPPMRLQTHFGVVKLRDRVLSPAAEYLIQLATNEAAAAAKRAGGP